MHGRGWARVAAAAAVVALGLTAGRARAESNDEVLPQFQFNFSTPGARANAMGGAFIGLADDGSASISNLAGLVRLARFDFLVGCAVLRPAGAPDA